MIRRLFLLAAGTALIGAPAIAQDHSMHGMSGMTMPMPAKPSPPKKPVAKATAAKKKAPAGLPARKRVPGPGRMEGMDHSAVPGMAMPATPKPTSNAKPADSGAMPGMDMPAPVGSSPP